MFCFGTSVIHQLRAMPDMQPPTRVTATDTPVKQTHGKHAMVRVTPVEIQTDRNSTEHASGDKDQLLDTPQRASQAHVDTMLRVESSQSRYSPQPSPSVDVMTSPPQGNLFMTVPSTSDTHVITPAPIKLLITSTSVAPSTPPHSQKHAHIAHLRRHIHVLCVSGSVFGVLNLMFAIWPLAQLYLSLFTPITCMLLSVHSARVATAARTET